MRGVHAVQILPLWSLAAHPRSACLLTFSPGSHGVAASAVGYASRSEGTSYLGVMLPAYAGPPPKFVENDTAMRSHALSNQVDACIAGSWLRLRIVYQ